MRHIKALTLSLSKILTKQESPMKTTGRVEDTQGDAQKGLVSRVDILIRATCFYRRSTGLASGSICH